jgi:hypothetical protein
MSDIPVTPATFISSTDLEERLALWREIAAMQRDKHEQALILGRRQLAIAVDFGADAIETCIADVEELIRETRGEMGDGEGVS